MCWYAFVTQSVVNTRCPEYKVALLQVALENNKPTNTTRVSRIATERTNRVTTSHGCKQYNQLEDKHKLCWQCVQERQLRFRGRCRVLRYRSATQLCLHTDKLILLKICVFLEPWTKYYRSQQQKLGFNIWRERMEPRGDRVFKVLSYRVFSGERDLYCLVWKQQWRKVMLRHIHDTGAYIATCTLVPGRCSEAWNSVTYARGRLVTSQARGSRDSVLCISQSHAERKTALSFSFFPAVTSN